MVSSTSRPLTDIGFFQIQMWKSNSTFELSALSSFQQPIQGIACRQLVCGVKSHWQQVHLCIIMKYVFTNMRDQISKSGIEKLVLCNKRDIKNFELQHLFHS